MRSALYEGHVVHDRRTEHRNRFRYSVYMWLVDLDELAELDRRLWAFGHDRRGLTTIRSRDHLGDPGRTIKENLLAYLAAGGIDLDGGRVSLLTNARVLGYVFNPLSVYYCHGHDGGLRCVVAEVHNTHGGRHRYLLRPDPADGELRTGKQFYVSPFLPVDGEYRMLLPEPAEDLSLHISLVRADGRPLTASLTGHRLPATAANVLRLALRYPLHTLMISARIRWHGIRLFLKCLPVVPRSDQAQPTPTPTPMTMTTTPKPTYPVTAKSAR